MDSWEVYVVVIAVLLVVKIVLIALVTMRSKRARTKLLQRQAAQRRAYAEASERQVAEAAEGNQG